jgi:hypothetical protein
MMFKLLYSPDDNPAPIKVDNVKTTSTDLDFLSADDEPEPEKDIFDLSDPKPKDKKETVDKKDTKEDKEVDDDEEDKLIDPEEDDELKEIEEELEGPKDEQLELMVPARRREILKEFPDLFKKFPYLERAFYREQAFTEIHPTIDDARLDAQKAKALDNFENELMQGNTEKILKAVKEGNPDSFYKLVDDYLPTLARTDEKAYHHVLGSVIKSTIQSMVEESKTQGNDQLEIAAQLLNQFVFGTSKFEAHKPLSSDKPENRGEKKDDVSEERRAYIQERFEAARDDLSSRVDNTIKATIDANIDPKGTMTDYVKRAAIREVTEKLETLMAKDTRFKTILDRLWEESYKDKFSKNSLDKIKSAYVARARPVLQSLIKTARNEALKGMGKRVVEDKDDTSSNKPKNKSGSRSNDSDDNKKVTDDRSKSTLELLMED